MKKTQTMNDRANRLRFYTLILEFIISDMNAEQFVKKYMTIWKKKCEAQWTIKKTWPEPYDQQLFAAVRRKEISTEEFNERWNELWGEQSETEALFSDMTDRVFTACDVYREKPEAAYEIDEKQLRAFVAQPLSSFLLKVSKPEKVGAH